MDFGKLDNLEGVDFSIPNLKIQNDNPPLASSPNIYLGTTGWSNKEWLGSYYPHKAKPDTFLAHYGALFNTIELNTTHYQIPSIERIVKWCDQVGSQFRFCPKVPQLISHRPNIASETSQSKTFFDAVLAMGDKLGACFMQLPVHFDPSQADKLLRFLDRKPHNIPFAVELRHPKWFENDNYHLALLATKLTGSNTNLVITDVAGRRDASHGLLPGQMLMLRIVGNGLHSSDYTRIEEWVSKIVATKQQLDEVYIFFHQPSMNHIPEMVNYFIDQLTKSELIAPIAPLKAEYAQNIQLRLF